MGTPGPIKCKGKVPKLINKGLLSNSRERGSLPVGPQPRLFFRSGRPPLPPPHWLCSRRGSRVARRHHDRPPAATRSRHNSHTMIATADSPRWRRYEGVRYFPVDRATYLNMQSFLNSSQTAVRHEASVRHCGHNCDFTLPQNGDFPLPPRGFRPPLWPQLSAHRTAPICARGGGC